MAPDGTDMRADFLIRGAREIVTTMGASDAPLAGDRMREVFVFPRGFVAARGGTIVAIGSETDLAHIELASDAQVIDAEGKVVIPGLVDPHTHLLFMGGREDEFFRRIEGESYMAIAGKGGGIKRTVSATRGASHKELCDRGFAHLALMLRQGTTTVEIKSGYGLSIEGEMAMLMAIDQLARQTSMGVVATFLGAHAVPPEYKGRADEFVDLVIDQMLPAVQKSRLATFCDVFCENGAFTVDQSRKILKAAADLGFSLKVHGDELTHSGGCRLAAELRATSVDHCNFASDADLEAMRAAGTIAVALPGTPFFLLAPRYANGRAILEAGVPLALATDYNPTSSISSMTFVMFLACLNMKLAPEEALTAATINAAHAIGLASKVGSLEVGKSADALILNVEDFRHIPFYVGRDIVDLVVKSGHAVSGRRVGLAAT